MAGNEPPGFEEIAALTSDEQFEWVGQLHATMVVTHRRLLLFLSVVDEQERWKEDGAVSMVDWVLTRLSVSRRTAVEWLSVARRLRSLPAIDAVVAEGRLSFDQLSPLTTFATEASDEVLAGVAPGWSAAETKALADQARAPKVADAEEAHRARRLTWWSDRQLLHVRGELPTEAGAELTSVLTTLANEAPKDPDTGTYEPFECRAADALVELASARAAELSDPDRPLVVVHTDPAALSGDEEGEAELGEGRRIAAETARRLACDCRWQLVVENEEGEVVRLGRTTRQVPNWLLRQLRRRDRGCRFSGCSATRWLHAHHVTHWANGGPTDQDNLILLCRRHHRVVHEGGWKVTSTKQGTVAFEKPDGRVLTNGPPPLRPDVRRRLFGPDPPAAHLRPSDHPVTTPG